MQKPEGLTGAKGQANAELLKQIGDKSSGHAADAKEKMKEGFTKGEFSPGSKIKEKVIPLSQSSSRALRGKQASASNAFNGSGEDQIKASKLEFLSRNPGSSQTSSK